MHTFENPQQHHKAVGGFKADYDTVRSMQECIEVAEMTTRFYDPNYYEDTKSQYPEKAKVTDWCRTITCKLRDVLSRGGIPTKH